MVARALTLQTLPTVSQDRSTIRTRSVLTPLPMSARTLRTPTRLSARFVQLLRLWGDPVPNLTRGPSVKSESSVGVTCKRCKSGQGAWVDWGVGRTFGSRRRDMHAQHSRWTKTGQPRHDFDLRNIGTIRRSMHKGLGRRWRLTIGRDITKFERRLTARPAYSITQSETI